MRCDLCPLCNDEPCGLYEDHAIEDDKDGMARCNVPLNRIRKLDEEYGEYLGQMGTDMGIDQTLDMLNIEKDNVLRLCKHMIGLDCKAPYHRNGKAYYIAYRNYFDAPPGGDKYLDALPRCIIEKQNALQGGVWYTLTQEGLDWLGRMLHMTIHEQY